MIKATRVGNTIICFIQSKMYQKTFESDKELIEVYEQLLNVSEHNEEEIQEIINIFKRSKTQEEIKIEEQIKQQEEEAEAQTSLLDWMKQIEEHGDDNFEVKGSSLYIKGINITIPEFLAREFQSRRGNEEDTKSLINFWRLLALNPDPRCREDLYKFLINNHMVVTPSGYFLAYRNANVKKGANSENKDLREFVSKTYIKVKGWKKSPKNYTVVSVGGQYMAVPIGKEPAEETTIHGNLQDLQDKFFNEEAVSEVIYTDAHSGSTTIIIGQPVSIPREDCDADPDRTCSNGLHLGSTNFMSKGYFGSVGLVCLCNPMHVVAVPYTDGQKLRTSEYLPIGVAEYDDKGKIIPIESATFEYDYAGHTEEQIEEMLKTARFESLKEHKVLPLEITISELRNALKGINVSREDMKSIIESRIKKV